MFPFSQFTHKVWDLLKKPAEYSLNMWESLCLERDLALAGLATNKQSQTSHPVWGQCKCAVHVKAPRQTSLLLRCKRRWQKSESSVMMEVQSECVTVGPQWDWWHLVKDWPWSHQVKTECRCHPQTELGGFQIYSCQNKKQSNLMWKKLLIYCIWGFKWGGQRNRKYQNPREGFWVQFKVSV